MATKIRVRGQDRSNSMYYVTIYDGVPRLYARSGMEHALSSIAEDAMALQFALEDARTEVDAIIALKKSRLTNLTVA